MANLLKKESLIFAVKVVLIWLLLNIPAAFAITPLVLGNSQNKILIEAVGSVVNMVTFPIALWFMFRRSKLDANSKFNQGLLAYFVLVFFQVLGLIGNASMEDLISVAATLSVTYLSLTILSGKKSLR